MEQKGTEIFFHCKQDIFNKGTWSLDYRNCKSFLLRTDLLYAQVPFATGLTIKLRRMSECCLEAVQYRLKHSFHCPLFVPCFAAVFNGYQLPISNASDD
jgi:hypothetical protein